jgi:hypothetical protein
LLGFVALLLLPRAVAAFGVVFEGGECGECGRYDESELTGEEVVRDPLSLAWAAIAAGGSANVDSARFPLLLGRISVEGAGVGSVVGDIFKSYWAIFAARDWIRSTSAR